MKTNIKSGASALFIAMLLVSMAIVPAGSAVGAQAANKNVTLPTEEMNLSDPNVIFFNVSNRLPLENKSRFVFQGENTPTGCRFNVQLQINNRTEPPTKVLREIALNPTTCQQLVEQGTLNISLQHETGYLASTQGEKVVVSNNKDVLVQAAGSAQAIYTTTWYEPLGAKVNYVSDIMKWWYDGTKVTGYSGSDGRWWLSLTGWYEASHNFQSYPDGTTGAVSSTYDNMRNNIFCALQTTNVWYDRNNVEGYGDGSARGWGTSWADGGCSGLLSKEVTLSVTYY